MLYGSSNNYFFWTDDIKGAYCKCEKCKDLSPSDQNLILMNAIVRKLREKDPNAKMAYLAYYDSVEVPLKAKPEKGIFLEYAPYERNLFLPANQMNEVEIEKVKRLLTFFGKKNSCVLEYWYDNSLFSGYQKPPKKFVLNESAMISDIAEYKNMGFDSISTFACFLGADYQALHGDIDITPFSNAVSE